MFTIHLKAILHIQPKQVVELGKVGCAGMRACVRARVCVCVCMCGGTGGVEEARNQKKSKE